MANNYRCPNCGKPTHLTRHDAAQLVVCNACGLSFVAPSLGLMYVLGIAIDGEEVHPEAPPEAAPHDETIAEAPHVYPEVEYVHDPTGATLTLASPPPEPAAPVAEIVDRRERSRGLGWLVVPVLAAMILVVVGFLGNYAITWLREAERQAKVEHVRAILTMKSQAETFALAEDYAAAHERYQAIEQLAAARPSEDPVVKSAVTEARVGQSRAFELLLAKQREKLAQQRPVERPVQPVATTQPIRRPIETPSIAAGPVTQPVRPPAIAVKPPAPVNPLDLPPLLARLPQRPPPQPILIPVTGITDKEIGQAIERGVDHLLAQFRGQHEIGNTDEPMGAGLNVLAVYALLQSGQAITDSRLNPRATFMRQVLNKVRELDIKPSYETYTRGLRATLLAVYNRPEDKQVLREDVAWLLRAHRNGAYDYRMPGSASRGSWDNSNSQYGLLGVWSAAEAGIEVPRPYWAAVQNHWFEEQCTTGEWGYHVGGTANGRPSMTVAGLASLFVTHDYLDAAGFGAAVGRAPFTQPLARGLSWLETGNNVLANFQHDGYSLYGLERVGLASGFKYFGQHDWYRTLADSVVRSQNPDGGWGAIRETSYKLLFLSRGRHPLIMNKLRFDGYWANRPRDLANLARFASRELERPINWQIVPIERDWTDWTDSPILYVASHEPIALGDAELAKLRSFVNAGGMIFSQADGGSAKFNAFMKALGPKLFPNYEWRDLPADHELFSLNFKIDPKPKLQYIGNGSRILMLHAPDDLAQHWQLRAERSRRSLFEFGINLFLYAGGKSDLRNRLSSTHLPQPLPRATYEFPIAHVRYAGHWNPEPHALPRFSNYLQFATGYRPRVEAVDMAALDVRRHPIAFLTGTAAHTASEAEVAAVRNYVESGGTLIINACGGSPEFNGSIGANLLPRAFPAQSTRILPPNHPIFEGKSPGMDPLPRPLLRPIVESNLGRAAARVEVLSAGNGRVLYSPLDITSSLLGTNTHSIVGYRPAHAQSLLKNILLWLGDGAPASY